MILEGRDFFQKFSSDFYAKPVPFQLRGKQYTTPINMSNLDGIELISALSHIALTAVFL